MSDDGTDTVTPPPLTFGQQVRLCVWRVRRTVYELSYPFFLIVGAWATMFELNSTAMDEMKASKMFGVGDFGVLGILWNFALTLGAMFFIVQCMVAVFSDMGTAKRLRRYFSCFAMMSRTMVRAGETYKAYARLQEQFMRDENIWGPMERDLNSHGRWVMTGMSFSVASKSKRGADHEASIGRPAKEGRPRRSDETWGGRRRGETRHEETRPGNGAVEGDARGDEKG